MRYDSNTGQPVYHDPKPRVVPLDIKGGKYGLRWISYDGREKTIVYERPDAIDAVVIASASRTPSGQYVYVYNVKNLPSSGQHLSAFALQTFSSDVKAVEMKNVHIGHMAKFIDEFKNGIWTSFAPLPGFKPAVVPGRSIELRLVSPAPPGLVECRVDGGAAGMTVVGEEPPPELLAVLPGYEAWPSGYTIGPIDTQRSLSPTERAKYIHDLLPQFRRLGWITPDALRWYEQNLRGDSLGKVFRRAEQDLKMGKITSEVHDMIQALRH